MEKGYVVEQLKKNEEAHDRLGEKIESLKEKIHQNHIDLLGAIHSNKVDTEKLKTRYGLYGVGLGSIPLVADFLIKNFK